RQPPGNARANWADAPSSSTNAASSSTRPPSPTGSAPGAIAANGTSLSSSGARTASATPTGAGPTACSRCHGSRCRTGSRSSSCANSSTASARCWPGIRITTPDGVSTHATIPARGRSTRVWLDLLFPPTCLGCGALRPQESLCPACAAATGTLPSPEALPEVWAELPYDGAWAGALHQLKYRGQLAFAGPLGRRLGCSPVFAEPWDALVPVPLHWRRRWRRGFNQVELLLRAATARRPDLRGRVVPALLQRVRAGPPQATLPAQA